MKCTTATVAATRRHYYILRGEYRNTYALRWTDSAALDEAAQALGYERITRDEAIRQAHAERERRKCDPCFAGFADDQVRPLAAVTRAGQLIEVIARISDDRRVIADRA